MDELDDELQAFLTEHRLEAHADAFAREGYDSLQYLLDLAHDEDPDALNDMLDDVQLEKPGHRRRFRHYLLKHRAAAASTPRRPFERMNSGLALDAHAKPKKHHHHHQQQHQQQHQKEHQKEQQKEHKARRSNGETASRTRERSATSSSDEAPRRRRRGPHAAAQLDFGDDETDSQLISSTSEAQPRHALSLGAMQLLRVAERARGSVWRLGLYQSRHRGAVNALLSYLKNATDSLGHGDATSLSEKHLRIKNDYVAATGLAREPTIVAHGELAAVRCASNSIAVLARSTELRVETASAAAAAAAAAASVPGGLPRVSATALTRGGSSAEATAALIAPVSPRPGTEGAALAAAAAAAAAVSADASGSESLSVYTDCVVLPSTPLKLLVDGGIAQTSMGADFGGAVLHDGALMLWGANYNTLGALQRRSVVNDNAARQQLSYQASSAEVRGAAPHVVHVRAPGALGRVRLGRVSCGYGAHAAALAADGSALFTWGLNDGGQLGRVGVEKHPSVVELPGDVGALEFVACGARFTVCAARDGRAFAFGINANGQCGLAPSQMPINKPVEIKWSKVVAESLKHAGVRALSAGATHAALLLGTGVAVTWGNNTYGQLGRKVSYTKSYKPDLVLDVPLAARAVCGVNSTALISHGGEAWLAGLLCASDWTRHQITPRAVGEFSSRFVFDWHSGETHHAALEHRELTAVYSTVCERLQQDSGVPAGAHLSAALALTPALTLAAMVERALRANFRSSNMLAPHVTCPQLPLLQLLVPALGDAADGELTLVNGCNHVLSIAMQLSDTLPGAHQVVMSPAQLKLKPGKAAKLAFRTATSASDEDALGSPLPSGAIELLLSHDKWQRTLAMPVVYQLRRRGASRAELLDQSVSARAGVFHARSQPASSDALAGERFDKPYSHIDTANKLFASMPHDRMLDSEQLTDLEYSPLDCSAHGVLFAARYSHTPVAVKMCAPTALAVASGDLQLFAAQLGTAMTIESHRNVLRCVGVLVEPLALVYAQPACTLFKLYHVAPEQMHGQALAMARDLASGLHFLHCTAGVVHGALSSRSVFLDERFVVKIGDVGTLGVRHRRRDVLSDDDECERSLVRWTAPELLGVRAKLRTLDVMRSADTYAAGIIFWEMCARTIPYPSLLHEFIVAQAVISGQRPSLEALGDDVPKQISKTLLRCWGDVAKRPTAKSLCERIDELQALSERRGGTGSRGSHGGAGAKKKLR